MKKTLFCENWTYWNETGDPAGKKEVMLPHDAMLETGRDPKSEGGGAIGFFKGGKYVYEKHFMAPDEWKNCHTELEFEGVYKNSIVEINGAQAGGAAYGYIPFRIDLDKYLKFGEENTIRVVADNTDLPNSRWYTGAGIYRPVWLWQGTGDAVRPYGVRVKTVSVTPAVIEVNVTPFEGADWKGMTVEITDCVSGEKAAETVTNTAETRVEITIPDARLWSDETPDLYCCCVTTPDGDVTKEIFGIRKITWSADGLFVNGKQTLLRGGCVHHDSGVLGAATYDGSEFRRVERLKKAGYNAIRSSHNPASRAMLEACDRLGMYVMDEAWDMWYNHKNKFDYAKDWSEHYRSDLAAIVERDYNHPSVLMYSIGNEVSEPAKKKGVDAVQEMVDLLHSLDPDRPVTGGFNLMIISSSAKGKGIYDEEKGGRKQDSGEKMNGMSSTMFNLITSMVGTGMNKAANSSSADKATSPSLDLLDICGYNYASGRYAMEGKKHPGRILVGSETFPQDIAKNWAMVEKYPYLIGDFMWTSWDYMGEAGIGAWAYTDDGKGFEKPYPWMLADVGAIDIIGTEGAPAAHARAAWRLDEKPWIGVQPVNHGGKTPSKGTWRGTNAIASWSFADCEGEKAIVEVYSSAAAVEVFLNGKSLGKKKTRLGKAVFKTHYSTGTIEAAAYDAAGKETGRTVLTSAKGKLEIHADTEQFDDITFINLALTDENGIVECNADRDLTVSVTGGELLGFGSANPRTEEDFRSGTYKTYYGRALAVVRSISGTQVTIRAEGMNPVSVRI